MPESYGRPGTDLRTIADRPGREELAGDVAAGG